MQVKWLDSGGTSLMTPGHALFSFMAGFALAQLLDCAAFGLAVQPAGLRGAGGAGGLAWARRLAGGLNQRHQFGQRVGAVQRPTALCLD